MFKKTNQQLPPLPEGYTIRKLPQAQPQLGQRSVQLYYRPVGIMVAIVVLMFLELQNLGLDILSSILCAVLAGLLVIRFS